VVDVAARAGVSTSTAARVLRGSRYPVSAELAARVRKVAEEVGYVPNVLARSFRHGRQASVGLIVGDMLDPYFGTISEAVTVQATNAAFVALVCNMQRDPQLEISLCERLWGYRVGGLILASGGTVQPELRAAFDAVVKRMMEDGITVVALAPRGEHIPTIGVDNRAVGELIAARLLALGHREVGVIAGPQQNLTQRERLAGLRRALAQAGARDTTLHGGFSAQAGATGVDFLLSANPQITALVGGSDSVAFGAAQRLKERGLKVPDDVSVLGIGNTSLAALAQPRLATVDIRLAEAAQLAVDYVAAQLAGTAMPIPAPLPADFIQGPSLALASEAGVGKPLVRNYSDTV
jgi:LacI family transcriptional regulator